MGILETMQIRRWMFQNAEDYTDPKTGELCCTLLAEAACFKFTGYDGSEVPESYFELAHDTMREIEQRNMHSAAQP